MKLTKTRQTWLEHVNQCEASKDRMSDYAKEHGLNVRQFYQIKSTFRKEGLLPAVSTSPKVPPRFTQVMIDNASSAEPCDDYCEIRFNNALVLRFAAHLPSAQIKNDGGSPLEYFNEGQSN